MSDVSRLTTSDAFEFLCEVEEAHDLLQHRVDGWAVWPVFRFAAARGLTAGLPQPSRQPTPARRIAALRWLASDAAAVLSRRAEVVIKTYSSGLAEKVGDRYRDIWFDDLLAGIGPAFKIEEAANPNDERRYLALTRADVHFESIELATGVARRALHYFSRDTRRIAQALSSVLIERFELPLYSPALVEGILGQFRVQRSVYAWILRRIQPSWLLVADPGEIALVAAARGNGIRVAELQHGILDRTHAGYAWTDYATPHRPRMPVPDRLFLYGDYWKTELARSSFWGSDLRAVGSPRIDRFRVVRPPRSGGGKTVLITTQGMEAERIVAFTQGLAATGSPATPMRIVVKLHPVYAEDEGIYRSGLAGLAGVAVLSGADHPSTFELLRSADLHLSISSTVHYDALALGVPTGILPFVTADIMRSLHAAGHAPYVATVADALRLLSEGAFVPPAVSEYYYATGAVENIRRELRESTET